MFGEREWTWFEVAICRATVSQADYWNPQGITPMTELLTPEFVDMSRAVADNLDHVAHLCRTEHMSGGLTSVCCCRDNGRVARYARGTHLERAAASRDVR